MYKIDDEFRPGGGRVFIKATQENFDQMTQRKSNLRKGPAITTNLDDRNIRFKHEVKHEKTIEAVIRDYPDVTDGAILPPASSTSSIDRTLVISKNLNGRNRMPVDIPTIGSDVNSFHSITKNKRMSTEVLGSSMESTKLSQRAPDGHRRITTHIVRKVTTLSRAEEKAQAQNLLHAAKSVRTTEIGYHTPQPIEAKRPKVVMKDLL